VVALCELLRDEFGLSRVRLTGGEPLLRSDVVEWVHALAGRRMEVTLTTNGQRMAPVARRLKEAGLGRVNVSLDTLDEGLFRRMCGGELRHTLAGIEAALNAGLTPVKTNTVVLRGWNEEHVLPIARYAFERGIEPRFLEVMNIGAARRHFASWHVSARQILDILHRCYELHPLGRTEGETARRYEAWRNGRLVGSLGLIAPESTPFCSDCGRLRLSCDGVLFACLMDERGTDLMPCLDRLQGPDGGRLAALVRRALAQKTGPQERRRKSSMAGIGG